MNFLRTARAFEWRVLSSCPRIGIEVSSAAVIEANPLPSSSCKFPTSLKTSTTTSTKYCLPIHRAKPTMCGALAFEATGSRRAPENSTGAEQDSEPEAPKVSESVA